MNQSNSFATIRAFSGLHPGAVVEFQNVTAANSEEGRVVSQFTTALDAALKTLRNPPAPVEQDLSVPETVQETPTSVPVSEEDHGDSEDLVIVTTPFVGGPKNLDRLGPVGNIGNVGVADAIQPRGADDGAPLGEASGPEGSSGQTSGQISDSIEPAAKEEAPATEAARQAATPVEPVVEIEPTATPPSDPEVDFSTANLTPDQEAVIEAAAG